MNSVDVARRVDWPKDQIENVQIEQMVAWLEQVFVLTSCTSLDNLRAVRRLIGTAPLVSNEFLSAIIDRVRRLTQEEMPRLNEDTDALLNRAEFRGYRHGRVSMSL